jgi:hypothetical protein
MAHLADHHEALSGTLTDKQKELLEKFDDCYGELTDISEREVFVYAFRLGVVETPSASVDQLRHTCSFSKETVSISSVSTQFEVVCYEWRLIGCFRSQSPY